MKYNKISVYGDIITDEYLFGSATRISPEAPVPVIDHQRSETRPGGAANVYKNINSLLPDKASLNTSNDGEPIRKLRIFGDNHMIARIDFEQNLFPAWSNKPHDDNDLIVVSDYDKGSITEAFISSLRHREGVIVDPKKPLSFYQDVWCIKPNLVEFESYVQKKFDLSKAAGIQDLTLHTIHVAESLKIKHFIVTLGKYGVVYFNTDTGRFVRLPSHQVEVFDVTGAGDTFTATLASSVFTGKIMVDSVILANHASAIAVSKIGTYTITPDDLPKRETVVFTNGCFDLLHEGHISYLRQSKSLGDKLVVGLNSDASIHRLKGPSRPIVNQEARKRVLESLKFIDEVIIFDEDTPINLIEDLRPDIITKGSDYKEEDVVGNQIAKVVLIPYVTGCSSTNIINKVRNGK